MKARFIFIPEDFSASATAFFMEVIASISFVT
jgi:hypothetical protein